MDREIEILRQMEQIEDELKKLGFDGHRERMTDLRDDFGGELLERINRPDDPRQTLKMGDSGAFEYVVIDGCVYEPQRDAFGDEWYFVRKGAFNGEVLEE